MLSTTIKVRILLLATTLLHSFLGFSQFKERFNAISLLSKQYPDSALQLTLELKSDAEKENNRYGIAKGHFMLGIFYHQGGEFEKAVFNYLEAIRKGEEVEYNDKVNDQINQYRYLASIFMKFSAYDLAAEYSEQALRIAEESANEAQILNLYHQQAVIKRDQGDYAKGLEIMKRILPKREKGTYSYFSVLSMMSVCYNRLAEYDSTVLISKQMIEELPDGDFKKAIPHHNMGLAYTASGEYDKAAVEFQNALYHRKFDTRRELGPIGVVNTLVDFSKLYIKTEEIEKAKSLLIEGEAIIESIQSSYKYEEWFFELYNHLSQVYELLGDLEQSRSYKAKYEIALEKYVDLYQEHDMEILVNNYFNEIETQSKEATTRRYRTIVSASLLFILALTFSINRYNAFRSRKKLNKKTVDHKLAELKALKAQINPHFLFNALNSIHSFILEDKHGIAEEYLVKYGRLMRQILNHSDSLIIPLNEELDTLQLYVELEQLRVRQGFDYEIKIDEKVKPFETNIPSMVIQPFLENAIWHGVSKLETRGKITLSIESLENELEVKIIDNGVGFDSSTPSKDGHNSAGVRLVKERLELLKESTGEKSVIEIESEVGKGTKAILRFSDQLT